MKERIGTGSMKLERSGLVVPMSEVQQRAVQRQISAHRIKDDPSFDECPAFFPSFLDIYALKGIEQITTKCPNNCGFVFIFLPRLNSGQESWAPFRFLGKGKGDMKTRNTDFYDDLRGATTGYTLDLGS